MRTIKVFLHALAFLSLISDARSQTNVIIPDQGTPFPDGVVSAGEWDMSHAVAVPAGGSDSCRVAVASDAWGLYLAYMGHLESANALFPEVLLDIDHDRSTGWDADDRWFHVSATACHHQGQYGVYDDCQGLPNDWSAHPLINVGAPVTDTIEVAIPWFFLGITPTVGDTIGFAAVLTNTVSEWHYWPVGADRDSPGTWGHLVFPGASAIDDRTSGEEFMLWPNPSHGEVTITWAPSLGSAKRVLITDAMGRTLQDLQDNTSRGLKIHPTTPGVHLVTIEWANGRCGRRTFVNR
jgi:hypothetical protein